jgi:hypothetical protein
MQLERYLRVPHFLIHWIPDKFFYYVLTLDTSEQRRMPKQL